MIVIIRAIVVVFIYMCVIEQDMCGSQSVERKQNKKENEIEGENVTNK